MTLANSAESSPLELRVTLSMAPIALNPCSNGQGHELGKAWKFGQHLGLAPLDALAKNVVTQQITRQCTSDDRDHQ